MKKILFILIAIIAFVACDKKDLPEIVDKGKLNPDALITLNPGKLRSQIDGLTYAEIVEEAFALNYTSHYFSNTYEEDARHIGRGFNEQQKDLETPALKMLGIDVITAEGEYFRDLTYSYDVYIINRAGDTIGYVPDNVIANARVLIEEAFEELDYNRIYDIFNEAFEFYALP